MIASESAVLESMMETTWSTGYHTNAARQRLSSLLEATNSGDSCTIDATLARYNQQTFPVHVKCQQQDHIIVCTYLESFHQFNHELKEMLALRTNVLELTAQGAHGGRSANSEFISIKVNSANFYAVLRMLQERPLQLRLELTCSLME